MIQHTNTLSQEAINFINNHSDAYRLDPSDNGSIHDIKFPPYISFFTIIHNDANVGFMALIRIHECPFTTAIFEIEVGIYDEFNSHGYAWEAINSLLSDPFRILKISQDAIRFEAQIKRTNSMSDKIATHLESMHFIQMPYDGDLCYQCDIDRRKHTQSKTR